MATEPKKLDPGLVESRKEVVVNITLKGLAKAYSQLFHDKPVELYQTVARKADVLSKKMMTGFGSALSMPIGIMVRNGARVANDATTEGRYSAVGWVAGLAGAAASLYFGAIHGAAYLQSAAPALGNAFGTLGSEIVAGAASAVFLTVPAFTAGELVAATLASAAATVVSLLPAALNVPVAMRRSADRAKGIIYPDDVFDQDVEKNSLDSQLGRERVRRINNDLHHISAEQRLAVYKGLAQEFGAASAGEESRNAEPAGEAAPASAPKGPAATPM